MKISSKSSHSLLGLLVCLNIMGFSSTSLYSSEQAEIATESVCMASESESVIIIRKDTPAELIKDLLNCKSITKELSIDSLDPFQESDVFEAEYISNISFGPVFTKNKEIAPKIRPHLFKNLTSVDELGIYYDEINWFPALREVNFLLIHN